MQKHLRFSIRIYKDGIVKFSFQVVEEYSVFCAVHLMLFLVLLPALDFQLAILPSLHLYLTMQQLVFSPPVTIGLVPIEYLLKQTKRRGHRLGHLLSEHIQKPDCL